MVKDCPVYTGLPVDALGLCSGVQLYSCWVEQLLDA